MRAEDAEIVEVVIAGEDCLSVLPGNERTCGVTQHVTPEFGRKVGYVLQYKLQRWGFLVAVPATLDLFFCVAARAS